MTLKEALEGKEYIISKIETEDEELNAFLFSLGCYSGEKIVVISHIGKNLIISIKNVKYSIDNKLANRILIDSRREK